MTGAQHCKNHYTEIRPGTQLSIIRDLCLRKQGATAAEMLSAMRAAGLIPKCGRVTTVFKRYLIDQCGYDLRLFTGLIGGLYNPVIYKIVGRHHWDGGYEDYVNPNEVTQDLILKERKI